MRTHWFFITVFVAIMSSCSHSEDVIDLSKHFFYSLSDTTYGKPTDYYPLYDSLSISAKSDIVDIDDSEVYEKNDTFEVHCLNSYNDDNGTFNQDSVILFVAKDSTKQFKIIDSKGLIIINKDIKHFGEAIGAFKEKATNDLSLARTLDIVRAIMYDKYLEASDELRNKVRILDWSWETSYDGEAHGEGKIMNNLDHSVSGIKYHLKYYDRNENFMAEDEGSISKTLYPGEKYSFSFWSSNAKYPYTASLKLSFSENTILEAITSKHFTGTEYNDYTSEQRK